MNSDPVIGREFVNLVAFVTLLVAEENGENYIMRAQTNWVKVKFFLMVLGVQVVLFLMQHRVMEVLMKQNLPRPASF